MNDWTLSLGPALARGDELPLFLQIARAIAADVARGRLRPGAALPGTRTLATALEVHRNTVVAAYAELSSQGWIVTRQGGASCVADEIPEVRPRRIAARVPRRRGVPERAGFALGAPPRFSRSMLGVRVRHSLAGGVPDLRLVPAAALARAYRRALRRSPVLLDYADDGRGHPGLRAAIAEMLSRTRGLAATADDVVVTRGSQMALDLIGRALIAPGDVVAIEDPGYGPAWGVFARAGAELVPIPVDEEGFDVDRLARLCEQRRVRAVYLTPHHQYPTTVALSAARRLRLLALARRARIAVIEDDYDHEFHYDLRPILPLASADVHGGVVYVGTLAKILAPGLRLGYLIAPRELADRIVTERGLLDTQGDLVLEAAVAELFDDGEVQRHVHRARRIYHARRDAFVAALTARLGGALEVRVPAGGIALWARTAPGIDVELWQRRAAGAGVVFQTGRRFDFAGRSLAAARFGYAQCNERELTDAVAGLAKALPRGAR